MFSLDYLIITVSLAAGSTAVYAIECRSLPRQAQLIQFSIEMYIFSLSQLSFLHICSSSTNNNINDAPRHVTPSVYLKIAHTTNE